MSPAKIQKSLERALKSLMRGNVEGVITFDQIKKLTPDVSDEEILDFMENVKGAGVCIAGRRGHPTRIVSGPALEAWKHSEALRAEWRRKNNLTPTGAQKSGRGPGRPRGSTAAVSIEAPVVRRGRKPANKRTETHPVIARLEQGEELANLNLRITVGDNETVLPLKVALVPAA